MTRQGHIAPTSIAEAADGVKPKPETIAFGKVPYSMAAALKFADLDRNELAVLLVLFAHLNGSTWTAAPGMPTIAKMGGLSVRSVQRVVQRLAAKGILEVIKGPMRGHSKAYRLPSKPATPSVRLTVGSKPDSGPSKPDTGDVRLTVGSKPDSGPSKPDTGDVRLTSHSKPDNPPIKPDKSEIKPDKSESKPDTTLSGKQRTERTNKTNQPTREPEPSPRPEPSERPGWLVGASSSSNQEKEKGPVEEAVEEAVEAAPVRQAQGPEAEDREAVVKAIAAGGIMDPKRSELAGLFDGVFGAESTIRQVVQEAVGLNTGIIVHRIKESVEVARQASTGRKMLADHAGQEAARTAASEAKPERIKRDTALIDAATDAELEQGRAELLGMPGWSTENLERLGTCDLRTDILFRRMLGGFLQAGKPKLKIA